MLQCWHKRGEKHMKNNIQNQPTIYELTPSQEVVSLQLKFSLDKRVINILISASSEEKWDIDLMRQAINLAFLRNDCLHIRFVKKNRKWCQYFDNNATCGEIPYYEFSTKEEQEAFVNLQKSKPIKYKKGEVVKFFLIKTYDNKHMIFIKVCHLVADLYGLNIIYKDIFEIYDAIKSGKALPPALPKFEEVVKKDIAYKNDKKIQDRNREFFTDLIKSKDEPYYAGLHGLNSEIARKNYPTRLMKMFLVNNQTDSYLRKIDDNTCEKVFDFCTKNKITPSNFLFYAMTLTQSKLNNNTVNQLQLELSNCRATAIERKVAGTKAQSLGCYITINQKDTVKESMDTFNKNQTTFYRHLGFSDWNFQCLTHDIWKSSPIRTYYASTFSFVPVMAPKGVELQIYSNGKFALPVYFAIMFDVNSHKMQVAYDCQRKLYVERDVDRFHIAYQNVILQIIDDQEQKIADVKI